MPFKTKNKKSPFILKSIVFLSAGLLMGFVLSRTFFLSFEVVNETMSPTFKRGEKVLVLKFFNPQKNDVVLLKSPVEKEKVLLRRIIAQAGDQIEIKNKNIYLNNAPRFGNILSGKQNFPQTFSYRDNLPLLTLKHNQFFVLSDNYELSFDSRFFGIIKKQDILGKAIYKFTNHPPFIF